jgi:uncharacterized protein (DUF2062 family)
MPDTAAKPDAPRRSFWKRRLGDPVVALLTQGVTPDKLAATFAVGTAVSLFPFLGTTTALNIGVGFWFRMNQPLLHVINGLLTPLHLVMILVYVRCGEIIWRSQADKFSVLDVIRTFRDGTVAEFFQRFGWAGVHAFTAWLISAPFIVAALYYGLRPAMRRIASIRVPKNA